MTHNDLNFPQRKVDVPEIVDSTGNVTEKFRFTEKQVDIIVSSVPRAVEDIGQIVKEIAAIARIKEQSDADVRLINEETQKIVQSVRVEIDRLIQAGNNTEKKGEVAAKLLAQILNAITNSPDLDEGSRHRLIDSIFPIINAAVC